MTYVDQDGDPSTTNSSVTNLTLDVSADVVFAGLTGSATCAKTVTPYLGKCTARRILRAYRLMSSLSVWTM